MAPSERYSELQLTPSANLAVGASATKYLHPGQMAVSAEPLKLMTILGSCVAVCLWDPVRGAGGMVHYLLPQWGPNSGPESPRYGNIAIRELILSMKGLNCRTAMMQARVFGGGCVLKAFRHQGKQHLGGKNAELASQLLSEHGIRVVECDVLGNVTRKVMFHTDTGVAHVTRLGDTDGI